MSEEKATEGKVQFRVSEIKAQFNSIEEVWKGAIVDKQVIAMAENPPPERKAPVQTVLPSQ
jgi:hypothetical protein